MSQTALALDRLPHSVVAQLISPLVEMGAYEALWAGGTSFKKLADLFRAHPGALPSEVLGNPSAAQEMAQKAVELFQQRGVKRFGVRIHQAGEYPAKLRDARFPVELLYFQGWWNLTESPSVAVVGTRKPSPNGIRRAQRLVRELVDDDRTVVSGLAAGIDTVAHATALQAKGRTIAVIGTPLGWVYPAENRELQERIAREFLVVSQVPVCIYSTRGPKWNRLFFPERNLTMSALTDATVIVEAGETSGTLIQARAALHQGRKLFVLDSCFERGLKWPERFLEQGAVRVKGYEDMRAALPTPAVA